MDEAGWRQCMNERQAKLQAAGLNARQVEARKHSAKTLIPSPSFDLHLHE